MFKGVNRLLMRHEHLLVVKKVYLTLCIQLLCTLLLCVYTYVSSFWQSICAEYIGPLFPCISAIIIVCILALYVLNLPKCLRLVLFGVFTLSISLLLCVVITAHIVNGQSHATVLLHTCGITFTTFVILTALVWVVPLHLHLNVWWETYQLLFACLVMLLLWIICAPTVHILKMSYAWFGSLLFMTYIIVDTSRLAYCHTDDMCDVLCCTMELYLDIINLFIYFVKCLSDNDNDT